jgi:hypothetical protein
MQLGQTMLLVRAHIPAHQAVSSRLETISALIAAATFSVETEQQ